MSYNIINKYLGGHQMARGKSGRVVLEIDPELKRQIYATLENNQQTMKEWFIKKAEDLISGHKQLSLFETLENRSNSKRENGSDE